MTKSEVRPLREADLICAIDLSEAVEGWAGGRRNMLVSNFFSLFFGILADANVAAYDTGGGSFTLRSAAEVARASGYVIFGSSAPAPSFSQYSLASRSTALEGTVITPYLTVTSSEGRITFGRATLGTVYEAGLLAVVFDTGGGERGLMVARVAFPDGVPANRTLLYHVIFKPPFTENVTRTMFGTLRDVNQAGCADIYGYAFTVRSSGEMNAGPAARMFVGEGDAGLDHTVKALAAPLELEWGWGFTYTWGSSYRLWSVGVKKLDAAKTIREVGLVQSLYTDAGTVVPALIARWPVSPPVSKAAGEVVCAYAIIYATA